MREDSSTWVREVPTQLEFSLLGVHLYTTAQQPCPWQQHNHWISYRYFLLSILYDLPQHGAEQQQASSHGHQQTHTLADRVALAWTSAIFVNRPAGATSVDRRYHVVVRARPSEGAVAHRVERFSEQVTDYLIAVIERWPAQA